jgi:hypothetical protein
VTAQNSIVRPGPGVAGSARKVTVSRIATIFSAGAARKRAAKPPVPTSGCAFDEVPTKHAERASRRRKGTQILVTSVVDMVKKIRD